MNNSYNGTTDWQIYYLQNKLWNELELMETLHKYHYWNYIKKVTNVPHV